MKNLLYFKLIIIFIVWIVSFSTVSAFESKCVSVKDGDTIVVSHRGKLIDIRLYGIDTPEVGQDFGSKAKVFLSNLVYNKRIEIIPKTVDKYGRTVGLLFLDGTNVCQRMVESGHAWVYRKYCTEHFCEDWLEFEQNAQKKGIGLWGGNDAPTPPWLYRKTKENEAF